MERPREVSLYYNDTLNSHFLLPFSEGREERFIMSVTLPNYVELHRGAGGVVPCDVVLTEGRRSYLKLLKVLVPQPT